MKQSVSVFLALLVAILWALLPVLQKVLVDGVSWELSLLLGLPFYVIAAGIFVVMRWKNIRANMRKISWNHLGISAVATILCGFLANILFVRLLVSNNASWVAAITCTSPVITVAIAMLFLGERLTPAALIGVLLVTLGIVLLSNTSSI